MSFSFQHAPIRSDTVFFSLSDTYKIEHYSFESFQQIRKIERLLESKKDKFKLVFLGESIEQFYKLKDAVEQQRSYGQLTNAREQTLNSNNSGSLTALDDQKENSMQISNKPSELQNGPLQNPEKSNNSTTLDDPILPDDSTRCLENLKQRLSECIAETKVKFSCYSLQNTIRDIDEQIDSIDKESEAQRLIKTKPIRKHYSKDPSRSLLKKNLMRQREEAESQIEKLRNRIDDGQLLNPTT